MSEVSSQPLTLDFRKEDLTRFLIFGKTEILAYLHAIVDQNLLTTVSFGSRLQEQESATDFFVSSVLDIDEFGHTITIDCAQNAAVNLAASKAISVNLETLLDKIRINFSIGPLSFCSFEGRQALQAEIPKQMIRLQRREHYRVAVPIMHPVECTVVIEKPDGAHALTLKPLDLSLGGLGIFDDRAELDNTIGRSYENCRINLPGVGIIYASLQVTNSHLIPLPNGQKKRHIGFGFIKLSSTTGALLQKYILLLEREQNAKRNGLGWKPTQTNI